MFDVFFIATSNLYKFWTYSMSHDIYYLIFRRSFRANNLIVHCADLQNNGHDMDVDVDAGLENSGKLTD
jgi:hypothetical protein